MLSDLIERVENATGPDREIDLAVQQTTRSCVVPADLKHLETVRSEMAFHDSAAHEIGYCLGFLPQYTSSLDAVVALVERHDPEQTQPWSVHQVIGAKYYSASIEGDEDIDGGDGEGKTPALALLLAFLRSREKTAE